MKHSREAAALAAAAALLWLVMAAPAAAAPTVREFPIPTAASQPQDIVLGPDGNLWFTEKVASKIGRVIPSDPPVIEDFPLPTGFTEPFNITVGPDGRVWATAKGPTNAGVLKIDPANPAGMQGKDQYGAVTAAGIAAGPDGKIWFGDQNGEKVIRLDPATMDKEATNGEIPMTGFSGIRNLAPGPDGNVWVTSFGGKVARVTPAAGFTEFNTAGDTAWDITPGPDGNLWYTVPDGNRAGRITTAGAFTDFPATAGGDQFGITAGPDGALWIAQAVANSIGRVTTGGQFTEITGLTAGARPEYISPGPANTLWFTEKDGNRIGRITGIVEPTGPGPGPGGPTPDVTRPDVTSLRITRRVFRLGGLGTVIRWSQSEDGRVAIVFHRRVNGRWRLVPRRRMSFDSTAGNHRLRFRGRVSRRKPLRPGRYRMTMTVRDAAGNVSAPDRVRFRLLARLRR